MRDERDGRGFRCPFCGEPLPPSQEIKMEFGGETEGGFCDCGAVYVYDRTGRKLGEAYSDALLLAYKGDYDAAFSAPEEDYENAVLTYNQRLNRFLPDKDRMPGKGGKFFFLKRKK